MATNIPFLNNREARDELVQAAQDNGVLLLFGAGLSYYSGLPLFLELMAYILNCIARNDPLLGRMATEVLNPGNNYKLPPETLFQVLADQLGDRGYKPIDVFALGEPTFPHYAACSIAQTLNCEIVTTNFDLLIEKAAESSGINIKVAKIHGTVGSRRSIRVAVNRVWQQNIGASRKIVGLKIDNRTIFVAGYTGYDSDLFPLLSSAKKIIWLLRTRPDNKFLKNSEVVQLPNALSHLAQIKNKMNFVVGDIQDVLNGITGVNLAMPLSQMRKSINWRDKIDSWSSEIEELDSYVIIGRLLKHMGLHDHAEFLFEELIRKGRLKKNAHYEAAGYAGLISTIGPRQGRYKEVRSLLDSYKRLEKIAGADHAIERASLPLNCAEAAVIAGEQFDWRNNWSLLIPKSRPSKRQLSRYGWVLIHFSRSLFQQGHQKSAFLFLRSAKLLFRRLNDFSGYLSASRSMAQLAKLYGKYNLSRQQLAVYETTDSRFAGVLGDFWVQWQIAELDRMEGRFKEALSQMDQYMLDDINPSQKIWLLLFRLACERALFPDGDYDDDFLLLEPLVSNRHQISAKCYVHAEKILLALHQGNIDSLHAIVAKDLSVTARESGLHLESDFLILMRIFIQDPVLTRKEIKRVLRSKFAVVRICAFLAEGNAVLGRFRSKVLLRRLQVIAFRRGMLRESQWLKDDKLPDYCEIQLP